MELGLLTIKLVINKNIFDIHSLQEISKKMFEVSYFGPS